MDLCLSTGASLSVNVIKSRCCYGNDSVPAAESSLLRLHPITDCHSVMSPTNCRYVDFFLV